VQARGAIARAHRGETPPPWAEAQILADATSVILCQSSQRAEVHPTARISRSKRAQTFSRSLPRPAVEYIDLGKTRQQKEVSALGSSGAETQFLGRRAPTSSPASQVIVIPRRVRTGTPRGPNLRHISAAELAPGGRESACPRGRVPGHEQQVRSELRDAHVDLGAGSTTSAAHGTMSARAPACSSPAATRRQSRCSRPSTPNRS
jgi:hypothetical protein